MIRAFVFDLGGVLIRLRPPSDFMEYLRRVCRPGSLSPHRIQSAADGISRGKRTVRELHRLLVRDAECVSPWSEFRERFCDLQLGEETPGVRELLDSLRNRGRIVMLSNTNALHADYLRKKMPELFSRFDRLFFSHEVGSVKPEEGIFREAGRLLKLRPEEMLFAEDTPENCATARALGWAVYPVRHNAFEPADFIGYFESSSWNS